MKNHSCLSLFYNKRKNVKETKSENGFIQEEECLGTPNRRKQGTRPLIMFQQQPQGRRKSMLLLLLQATIRGKESATMENSNCVIRGGERERGGGAFYIHLLLDRSWSLLGPTRRLFANEGSEIIFDLLSQQRNREFQFLRR